MNFLSRLLISIGCVALLCNALIYSVSAQEAPVKLSTPTGTLHGTILCPSFIPGPVPVVLLIAGSGPTDRNGNQPGYQTNCLKLLADSLSGYGIASLRFDKRAIAESASAATSEKDLRFDTYVADAREWIGLLALDKRFSRIIVAGHSEGSLIGMIACENNNNVSGYISIAGPGRPADEILKEQLATIPEGMKQTVFFMIDKLKSGETFENVPEALNALFRPSVQPYMISWFQFDPRTEIKKLNIPVLILQGSTDIQVSVLDADLLSKARPEAIKKIIPNMNHVLKLCDSRDEQPQKLTYSNPGLPLHPQLMGDIVTFIRQIK